MLFYSIIVKYSEIWNDLLTNLKIKYNDKKLKMDKFINKYFWLQDHIKIIKYQFTDVKNKLVVLSQIPTKVVIHDEATIYIESHEGLW